VVKRWGRFRRKAGHRKAVNRILPANAAGLARGKTVAELLLGEERETID